ncbi:hypothetical protein LZ554_004468 [Drepanopeziza brunnea f. sp. 'monogermtubi']|nr:hypothetical protein LZ554_004468 [Drepanopeziza brunnea f. sp. 'monogermtubi']
MAPTSVTATAQSQTSKFKRPVPPGIQTNGIHSSTSSPSPSMPASRLPSAAKYPPNSATSNGTGSSSGPKSANRNKRDAPSQLPGRGQRNSSVGLRSGGIMDFTIGQNAEPQPFFKSDEYILRRYRGKPPSLIIHLYPNHFRFDQQEGSFTYKSPMRIVIEHLRSRTIPHDLLEFMPNIEYYEDCMIVQIHDHKSIAPSQSSDRPKSEHRKSVPFSIHNYNAYLTPSSYVSFPMETAAPAKARADADRKSPSTQKDKENMPAPALPNGAHIASLPTKPKISTIVLRPTPLSRHAELALRATEILSTSDGRKESRQEINGSLSVTVPPTPTTAISSNPQTSSMAPPAKRLKKSHAGLPMSNLYSLEAQITLATTAPLMLEPIHSVREAAALLEAMSHPMHSEAPPAPKTRKRTVAEMAADEAQAADQERHMLSFDERVIPSTAGAQGGSNPANGDGQVGGASFEPRFERFKTLENIRTQHEETKRADKQRREEAERKSKQDQERNKLRDDAEKREQEKQRTASLHQQHMAHQLGQEAARRRQAAQQTAQAQQGGQGAPHLQQSGQVQNPHGHPQPNGIAAQPQRFHQQQVSQTQASSPIVRNGTPQNHSSPVVNNMGNVPMQHSTSSMGGSPARPGSVVHQNHPQMGPGAHGMVAQRSQQSHAGTPRMPVATPNIQSTPLNRPMSQTPRMSQGSPMQGSMATMQVPMMNGQQMQVNSQQAQVMQQQQRIAVMMRNQQQAQVAQQNAGPNLQQAYGAQMAAIAQRSGGLGPNMNQNMMNGQQAMTGMPQMTMQQMQQMQQMRQQAQVQAQAQAMGGQQMNSQQYMAAQMMRQQQQQAAQQAAQQQQQPLNPQQQQHQAAQQQLFQQQVMATASAMYSQQRPKVAAQYANGAIPEEIDRSLRATCQQTATATVQRQFQARRAQHQQAMMAAQGGMQQNMNGMHNGMGM